MTLDNNAKIGDIITALEGMQAINQKAELASVIGSPATATDNIATQITIIQDAKDVITTKTGQSNTLGLLDMVNGIVIGKKWASGVSTSDAQSTSGLPLAVNGQASAVLLRVSGIDFKPSFIIISSVSDDEMTLVRSNGVQTTFLATSLSNTSNTTSSTVSHFKANTSPLELTENGFVQPVRTTNKSFNWIAFE